MIRKVTEHDTLSLSNLLRNLPDLSQVAAENEEATLDRVKRQLKQILSNPDISLLVDEEDGVFTAYCQTIWQPTLMHLGGEGYIAELFVHPEKRAKGIGSALLEQIIHEAKARGCSRLCLLNMKQKPSYGRAFYHKQGWEERPLAANFIYNLKDKS